MFYTFLSASDLEKIIYLHYVDWKKIENKQFNDCIIKNVFFPNNEKSMLDFDCWEVEIEDKVTKHRTKVYLTDVLWYALSEKIFNTFFKGIN